MADLIELAERTGSQAAFYLVFLVVGAGSLLRAIDSPRVGRALSRFTEARVKAKEAARADREMEMQLMGESYARMLDSHQKDIAWLKAKVTELEEDRSDLAAYAEWVASTFFGLKLYAAENGLTFPPPPLMAFTEWKAWRDST